MHIGTFAGYARRLEEISSRTALVALLAELFAAATPDDVAPATYLLQGRVAPAFVPLELGMGVVLVTEAVARAFHTEPALVRERFHAGETIHVAQARTVGTAEELMTVFDAAIGAGLEGIVAKKLAAPYQAGARTYTWVKLKRAQAGHLRDTVDCVVIGYLYGRGRRAALGVGALLVAVYDPARDVFASVSKIGTGLTDAAWQAVRERCAPFVSAHRPARVESSIRPSVWVEPRVVIEVLADEITRSPLHAAGRGEGREGYALRFPRLVSFRDADKRPEDATTVAEISALYQQQGGTPTTRTARTAAS
jgi:ATP-dependent DNA ligase